VRRRREKRGRYKNRKREDKREEAQQRRRKNMGREYEIIKKERKENKNKEMGEITPSLLPITNTLKKVRHQYEGDRKLLGLFFEPKHEGDMFLQILVYFQQTKRYESCLYAQLIKHYTMKTYGRVDV
jgi:hypothetical protein